MKQSRVAASFFIAEKLGRVPKKLEKSKKSLQKSIDIPLKWWYNIVTELGKAEREAKAAELVKKFGFVETIEGVSEKQIAYAKSLRDEYIIKNAEGIRKVTEGLNDMSNEEIEEFAKQNGITLEETIKNSYIYFGVEKAYSLKSEKSARKIIDMLK